MRKDKSFKVISVDIDNKTITVETSTDIPTKSSLENIWDGKSKGYEFYRGQNGSLVIKEKETL